MLWQQQDSKYLGWHADWPLHLQVLLLSPTDQVSTDWGKNKDKKTDQKPPTNSVNTTYSELLLRIAYTSRQGASHRIFILIAQGFDSGCDHFSELFFTLFQRFDVAAGEGDANAVDGDLGLNGCLASVLKSLHDGEKTKAWLYVSLASTQRRSVT